MHSANALSSAFVMRDIGTSFSVDLCNVFILLRKKGGVKPPVVILVMLRYRSFYSAFT